jgi:hypothetical protein
MHTNAPKKFHMIFHMNYLVKVKHYDQIIIKPWNLSNK